MFMVLFDVAPHPAHWEAYLHVAGLLRPEIQQIRGFIANERFRNEAHHDQLLSLSSWADEKALIRWRTHAKHHEAQTQGRSLIFTDYRLRVGEVISDTAHPADQPLPQQRMDQTETGRAKVVQMIELDTAAAPAGMDARLEALLPRTADNAPAGWVERAVFSRIPDGGKHAVLLGWTNAEAATAWYAGQIAPYAGPTLRCRLVRIIRHYGLRDRAEATQYYPAEAAEVAIW
jgi:heme-degrading monooxygenase HmoA